MDNHINLTVLTKTSNYQTNEQLTTVAVPGFDFTGEEEGERDFLSYLNGRGGNN